MTKICFVSLYAYPLFNLANESLFGGAEVRSKLFGDALSRFDDLEISFVVFDHGQNSPEHFGKIKIWKHPAYRLNQTRTRFQRLLDRLRDPNKIYSEINADIYCAFGASDFAAKLAHWCRQNGKRFILFAAGEGDFAKEYYEGSREINAYGSVGDLCYKAIQNAHQIILQTDTQKSLLRERFGRTGAVVKNPIDLGQFQNGPDFDRRDKRVIWIGKSDTVKRAELFIELAEQTPEVAFTMIMNKSDPKIFEHVYADKPSNVVIHERLSHDEVQKLMSTARALVNTSSMEGFPNTYLEAGRQGVPIFTLQADPDGFIEKYECGYSAKGDLSALTQKLRETVENKSVFSHQSSNVRRYVRENHDLELCSRKLYDALIDQGL